MLVTGMLGENGLQNYRKSKIDILAVFGGDTLMEIIKSMRAAGVRPLHEIEPGTVISDLIGGKYPIQIVSKSGGWEQKTLYGILSIILTSDTK